jgi:hypothetical protein
VGRVGGWGAVCVCLLCALSVFFSLFERGRAGVGKTEQTEGWSRSSVERQDPFFTLLSETNKNSKRNKPLRDAAGRQASAARRPRGSRARPAQACVPRLPAGRRDAGLAGRRRRRRRRGRRIHAPPPPPPPAPPVLAAPAAAARGGRTAGRVHARGHAVHQHGGRGECAARQRGGVGRGSRGAGAGGARRGRPGRPPGAVPVPWGELNGCVRGRRDPRWRARCRGFPANCGGLRAERCVRLFVCPCARADRAGPGKVSPFLRARGDASTGSASSRARVG